MSRLKTSIASNFLFALLILSVIGLFFVFEASTAESFITYGNSHHFLVRQLIWFGIGLAGFLLAYLVPLKVWPRVAPVVYVVLLILLGLTLVPSIGLEINAAKRWIDLGFTSLQPVEFFKLGLIIFFASWMSKHQRILPFVFLIALPAIILMLQPDVGSMLIILVISGSIYLASGGNLKKFLPILGVGLLFLIIAIFASPYRLRRVQTFFDPQSDPLGASFQIRQITLALGSGGWFGRGLGNSQQKYSFIPEVSSDSIFSIVAEEVGFVGSLLIVAVYSFLFYLIYKIALEQKSRSFEQLLAIGVLAWMAGQTILNLGSIVALLPLTGLPLPLFSYGGSSLVAMLFGAGLVYKMGRLKLQGKKGTSKSNK